MRAFCPGKWPDETGVTGNYYYCPQTGEEGFIEEKGYMKAPTLLQHYRGMGQKTALFTVKGKILGVYGEGAQIGLSAQQPDSALLDRYGLQPPSADSKRGEHPLDFACRLPLYGGR